MRIKKRSNRGLFYLLAILLTALVMLVWVVNNRQAILVSEAARWNIEPSNYNASKPKPTKAPTKSSNKNSDAGQKRK